ncbi:MAG TPA: hypothetical protein VL728_15865 [Cyclobacteriaceae bacterium]|jgi:hypothetical protein|nr:hypothetical protein [Cyclobacteriaceae bacterium]
MKPFSTVILCIIVVACGKKQSNEVSTTLPVKISGSSSKSSEDYNAQFKLENYLAGEQTDPSKVQVIDYDCAVLIYPTHEQVEEMKKTEGEEEFYTIADDANFYQTRVIQILDSAKIKTAGTEKQFIKFAGDRSSWTLDVRKKNLPGWNLILFSKKKAPQPTAAVNVTYDLVKSYFE